MGVSYFHATIIWLELRFAAAMTTPLTPFYGHGLWGKRGFEACDFGAV